MCTFNRNNRECIHLLKQDKKFIDLTEEEFYYMCNDELNIAGIVEDDLVKFKLHDAELKSTQRIYGFVKYLHNENHTTFMICEHYDETGTKFYLDYVYSSFHHAFHRLNHHGSFSDWNQLTHIKKAHAPQWFVTEWLDKHVVTDDIDSEFENTEPVVDVNDTEEAEAELTAANNCNLKPVDNIGNINKNIEQIHNKLNNIFDRIDELSNRVNILSKITVTDKSLENVNKPVYTKPGCINHVIC